MSFVARAYEAVTIDNTAGGVGLTAATYGSQANSAVIGVETAQIRFTIDGTAPTTTVGVLADPGAVIHLNTRDQLQKFKAIRTGSSSGTLRCLYGDGLEDFKVAPGGAPSSSGAAALVDTELTTADLDTGAGTDTRAVVGLVLAASGGAVALTGGSGVVGTGTVRVVLATDVALPRPAARSVSVTLTAAAAGDYAANDVVSNSATGDAGVAGQIAAAVTNNGEVAILDSVSAVCSEDSVVFRLRLHFYNYNPAAADVEMDDNAAFDFAKNATGAAGYLGYVDLPAFADRGTSASHSQADNLRKLLKCGASTTTLYYVVQTLDAEANETTSMTIRFDFSFLN